MRNKKKSGYQKLKDRIEELENEKRILIDEPYSQEAMIIKMQHNWTRGLENTIWTGGIN
jgi:hypothetical protein